MLALTAAAWCCWIAVPAAADNLDPGGLTFRDFGVADSGASFHRRDPMSAGGPNEVASRVLSVDNAQGSARIRFDSIKVEVAIPLGWYATEDAERGVAYSNDKSYRLLVWRVDFGFEGARDAEHYAAMKTGAIRSRRPTVEAQARKLPDGIFLIAYEKVPPAPGTGDRTQRAVYDLVFANPRNPKEGVLMTLGVPAAESDRGLKLLALLKQKIRIEW